MKLLNIAIILLINLKVIFAQSTLNTTKIDSIYQNYLMQIEIPKRESLSRLPEVKLKFQTNQLDSADLFLVTILRNKERLWEQVYMKVNHWDKDSIKATLSSEMNVVKGYPYGSIFIFTEDKVIDWLIMYPDGREEGNYIIKYINKFNH